MGRFLFVRQIDDFELNYEKKLRATILAHHIDVSPCVGRTLCRGMDGCDGFVYDSTTSTATLLHTSDSSDEHQVGWV